MRKLKIFSPTYQTHPKINFAYKKYKFTKDYKIN